MKKVLYFTSSHKIGLTTLLTEQACAIVKKSPESFLFLSGEKEQFPGLFDRLRSAGAHFERIEHFDDHMNFLRLVQEFQAIVEKFQPDIVHVQTNWQLGIAVYAKYLHKNRYAVYYTLHGYRHNYTLRSIIARMIIGLNLFLFVDRVFMSSTFLKTKFNFLTGKIEVMYLGVDENYYSSTTPLPPMKEKKLIFPGEFRAGKNQEMLIRAVYQYCRKTNDRTIRLYLPGGGKNIDTCKTLAHKLGIEDNVIFPGVLDREKLLQLYQECHCAVIPTNIETFGLSIVEPYVLGRIVISRRVGIAEDILLNGYNGYLFHRERDLVEILCDVLGNEPLLHQIAEKTKEGRNEFRWEHITDHYLRCIAEEGGERIPFMEEHAVQQKRVMIIWTKFFGHHIARIEHLKKRLDDLGYSLTAVEVASQDGLYPFAQSSVRKSIDFISCFTRQSYRELNSKNIYTSVYSLLKYFKPGIVFAPATPFPSGMASVKYRLRYNARSILMDDAWERTDKRGALVRWVKKNIHKNIDGAFIPARSHAAYFNRMDFPPERIVYGVDVVDNEYFSHCAARARSSASLIRRQLGVPEKYFLFVGRLLAIKGISTLMKAYQLYRRNSPHSPWALVVVGDGPESKAVAEASRECADIYPVGAVTGEKLCAYYGTASALIMPSERETWGLVVNEAMASGLPAIVSDGCGCALSLVEEDATGWTFSSRNADELSHVMAACSLTPFPILESMGRRAQERVGKYSLETFADGVIAALNIPRREKAGTIANLFTNFWTGRISMYP